MLNLTPVNRFLCHFWMGRWANFHIAMQFALSILEHHENAESLFFNGPAVVRFG
jgi:hypothetical protein